MSNVKKKPTQEPLMRATGLRLLWLREIFDLSQMEAAGRIDVTQQRWQRYEAADRVLDPYEAVKICEEFGVTMDFLFRGIMYPKPDPRLTTAVAEKMAGNFPGIMSDDGNSRPS